MTHLKIDKKKIQWKFFFVCDMITSQVNFNIIHLNSLKRQNNRHDDLPSRIILYVTLKFYSVLGMIFFIICNWDCWFVFNSLKWGFICGAFSRCIYFGWRLPQGMCNNNYKANGIHLGINKNVRLTFIEYTMYGYDLVDVNCMNFCFTLFSFNRKLYAILWIFNPVSTLYVI